MGASLVRCLLQAVSSQRQAGKKTVNFSLAGVPEKQGGLRSILAAPQAVRSWANSAGISPGNPSRGEGAPVQPGPPRLTPSVPSSAASGPLLSSSPYFPFLSAPAGCPIASSCRDYHSFLLSRTTASNARKASASPFPAAPPFCRIHTPFQLSPVVYRVEGSRLESELPIQALGMPTPPPPGLRTCGWCNGL